MNAPRHTARLALIGCGAIAEVNFIPALKHLRHKPELIVDVNQARAKRFAASLRCRAAGELDAVDRSSIDAAIVALPNALHAPVAISLLERGIHVLIEKPMATSTGDCQRMIAAAEAANLRLAVGHMYRFNPAYLWMKTLADSGILGSIRNIELRTGGPFAWPLKSLGLWQKAMAGGGVLIDLGIHFLDLLIWWFGTLNLVAYADDNCGGVEADCQLHAATRCGGAVFAEFSRTRELPNRLIIEGSDGSVEIDLAIGGIAKVNGSAASYEGAQAWTRRTGPSHFQLFVAEIADWLDSIREHRLPTVDGSEGAVVVQFIEECYRKRQPWVLPWVQQTAVPSLTTGAA